MKPSATIKLGTAFGIDILLHWSFFILPLLIGWLSWYHGQALSTTAVWMVLLVVVLFSVLLHELGHALTAEKLGIPIIDIMLTPICGLARLERAPARPWDEVMVALAGPLANLAAASLLGLLMWIRGEAFSIDPRAINASLWLTLLWINLSLFAINLLPIFPMDGGRILRAFLAMGMDSTRATQVAARLGQIMSILAIAAGIYWHIVALVIIGIFLIATAEQEIRQHFLYPRK
ncbi:MAG: hypothetical protein GY743_19205 [Planctomycetaceae bacterium]|nr:hypothetical protein [Planctomycetaceae bacterium]